MAYVLILMIMTSGVNGGNAIAMHKFDNKAACEFAESAAHQFKERYTGDIQSKCVPQLVDPR